MGKNFAATFVIGAGVSILSVFLLTGVSVAAGPSISTVFASYGYAMERKDVKDDVVKNCDGKASCTFVVKNENFSAKEPLDPSPGNDKGLIVSWKCGDTPHKLQFAEGRKATLDCN